MASLFSHTVAALTLGKAASRRTMPPRFWILSIFCSAMPDLDVIGFAFGIRYGDLLGHRGLSHSLPFALLTGIVVTSLAFRDRRPLTSPWWRLVAYFSIVTASHGVLDAFTDGGLGIAFFSPFDTTRYFFPARPIEVSPIGIAAFFSPWGARVLASELVWVGLPALAVLAVARLLRLRKDSK